tara:strand:- start:242 stop:1006 length:765 start_codon:yes stop_codon:yes gene_type:complete
MNEGLYKNKNANMMADTPDIKKEEGSTDLEVKPVVDNNEEHELPNPDDEEIFVKKPVQMKIEKKEKKKRQLSQRQLDHLKRMREKSKQVRSAKKQAKEQAILQKKQEKLNKEKEKLEKLATSNKLLDKKKLEKQIDKASEKIKEAVEIKQEVQKNPEKFFNNKNDLQTFFQNMNQFLSIMEKYTTIKNKNIPQQVSQSIRKPVNTPPQPVKKQVQRKPQYKQQVKQPVKRQPRQNPYFINDNMVNRHMGNPFGF